MKQEPFEIGGEIIRPGTMKTVRIPLPVLPHHTAFDLNIRVIHGHKPGKRLFVTSTIHGDELNGIEAIRRVLVSPLIKHVHGTLIAVPIVNLLGVLMLSRYLPDRRDLNRSFPGSEKGSAAAQLADTVLNNVVQKCTHGLDLHTGSNHRTNLPQVRCDFESEKTLNMAVAFGAPVILKADIRDGSLREACEILKIPTLTYEGGEALRFNEFAIRSAAQGIFRVMSYLKMIPEKKGLHSKEPPVMSPISRWLRAPATGIFRSTCLLGKKVLKGDIIGKISDPLGASTTDVRASFDGIVIGHTQLPLVYKGDALFNVAWVADPTKAEAMIEGLEEKAELNPALDDPSTY